MMMYMYTYTHTYVYIYTYIYIYIAVSHLLWSTKPPRPRAVPEPKIKNEIGHEMAKNGSFSYFFDKSGALDLNINISI